MIRYYDFITTKITSLIEEAVYAVLGVGGIESYPLGEYIYQSLLLRMVGFQEQKLKSVMWELATYDYDMRYKLLEKGNRTGEYSKYEKIKDLYDELKSKNKFLCNSYSIDLDTQKLYTDLKDLLKNTNLTSFLEEDFLNFSNYTFSKYTQNTLLPQDLKSVYKRLYEERNRIAHNTLSYQENLPKLKKLSNLDSLKNNYFMWFYVLVVIDENFIQLYKDYIGKIL